MADKTIGQLPELAEITDTSLLPVEQSGTAYHTMGSTWKNFIRAAAADEIANAETAADTAVDAAASAEAAAASASADKIAIQSMNVSSTVLEAGATPTLSKTVQAGVWNLEFGLAPGARGPQGLVGPAGPQGNTQVINYNSNYYTASVQPADGTIYFSVNNAGHLILTYAGNVPPEDYSIDDNPASETYGHLLWHID